MTDADDKREQLIEAGRQEERQAVLAYLEKLARSFEEASDVDLHPKQFAVWARGVRAARHDIELGAHVKPHERVHPPKPVETKPVCPTCNDTHEVEGLRCFKCPLACPKCRKPSSMPFGYCAQTPCPCVCHEASHG